MTTRTRDNPKPDKPEVMVTSIALPIALWRAVKVRAAHDRTDLRTVCIAALTAYLRAEGGE
jgi:hypothetical protein